MWLYHANQPNTWKLSVRKISCFPTFVRQIVILERLSKQQDNIMTGLRKQIDAFNIKLDAANNYT
jgi:hypothetical protein